MQIFWNILYNMTYRLHQFYAIFK